MSNQQSTKVTYEYAGESFDSLEALFRAAGLRASELEDENFTKVVLNRLPTKPLAATKRSWLPDLLGLLVALVAMALFIEPASLSAVLAQIVPSSIVLSAGTVLTASMAMAAAAILAFWVVERGL